MTRGLLLLAFLVLPALPVAHAADQTVLGSTLVVKDPGTPAKRKITVKAKETASDDTLVGDPTTGGATVTITATGGTPSSQTFTLPAGVSYRGHDRPVPVGGEHLQRGADRRPRFLPHDLGRCRTRPVRAASHRDPRSDHELPVLGARSVERSTLMETARLPVIWLVRNRPLLRRQGG
jgi:hypothetical protein